MALAQIAATREVAAASRAEDRALALLTERPTRYGEVVEAAGGVRDALNDQALALFTLHEILLPAQATRKDPNDEHWSGPGYERLFEARNQLREAKDRLATAIFRLHLIAPQAVTESAAALTGRVVDTPEELQEDALSVDDPHRECSRQQNALEAFIALYRVDVAGTLEKLPAVPEKS